MSTDWGFLPTFLFILVLVLLLLGTLGMREATLDVYNDGVCPDCNVEYTLQYVTGRSVNHYECPECGKVCKRVYTIFDRID